MNGTPKREMIQDDPPNDISLMQLASIILIFLGMGIIVIKNRSGKEISLKYFLPKWMITNPATKIIKLRN